MTTLGERIKLVRGGVSRDRFAPMTGISKTALVNYENNERDPSSEYLNKILNVFHDIDPTWLLTGEGNMRRDAKTAVHDAVPGWEPTNGHPASRSVKDAAPELDMALLEEIIIEVVKNQRMTGDEVQDLFVEVLARGTASNVISAYKMCHDKPNIPAKTIISNYNKMFANLNEQLTTIADMKDKEREG